MQHFLARTHKACSQCGWSARMRRPYRQQQGFHCLLILQSELTVEEFSGSSFGIGILKTHQQSLQTTTLLTSLNGRLTSQAALPAKSASLPSRVSFRLPPTSSCYLTPPRKMHSQELSQQPFESTERLSRTGTSLSRERLRQAKQVMSSGWQ